MGKPRSARQDVLVCGLLVAVTLAVFGQVVGFDFVNYDDEGYLLRHPMVRNGVTPQGVLQSLTSVHMANWHPLSWMSHMLDCSLYGLNPAGHHATGLLLHIASTLLLYFILKGMTGFAWRSAFVAALFAIHPFHVESVAWVAERKDTLSGLMFMLTIVAYVAYARRPSVGRYLAVVAVFALGLMAKSMLVTMPFIMLLLDYWPLRRRAGVGAQASRRILVAEKVPLLLLSLACGVITCMGQQSMGAIGMLKNLPLSIRIENALVTYVQYVINTFWPSKLAVFYPHPMNTIPTWQIPAAGVALLAVTAFSLVSIRRQPWLAVGWLWYIVMLLPVIGLLQTGAQSMADHFTYLPLIGLFIAITWGVAELVGRIPVPNRALAVAGVLAVCALMVCSWFQTRHWRNSAALFSHALNCTKDNEVAHNNYGMALDDMGRREKAMSHFEEALRINPENAYAHLNVGAHLAADGDTEAALDHLEESLRLKPNQTEAIYNVGKIHAMEGRLDEARASFERAVVLDPTLTEAHIGLGNLLSMENRLDEAVPHYLAALKLDPGNVSAHYNLGRAYASADDTAKAIEHYRAAVRSNSKHSDAHFRLALLLEDGGDIAGAVRHYRNSLRAEPKRVDAANNLAWILSTNPDSALRNPSEAVRVAERMCRATKNSQPMLLDTLAAAYACSGRFDDAVRAASKALALADSTEQELAVDIRSRLDLYQSERPFTQN